MSKVWPTNKEQLIGFSKAIRALREETGYTDSIDYLRYFMKSFSGQIKPLVLEEKVLEGLSKEELLDLQVKIDQKLENDEFP